MFAVVKTGGKQYKVAENDVMKVEKLAGDAGDTVTFDQVLMISDDKGLRTGTPLIDGAVVTAEILEQTRSKKVIVFKRRRRHTYRKRNGHRQDLTVLRVTGIGKAGKAAPKKKAAEAPKPAPAPEGAVLVAPEGAVPDDLKRISGVGKVLEGKLNALGVITFQQIVDMTPAQRDDVEEQLSFKGRMEREDWVGQAKAFIAENNAD